MNVSPNGSGYDAFFAVREAAARRMRPEAATAAPKTATVANNFLTMASRPVDPMAAAQSAKGPVKGRLVDFIA